MMASFSLAHCSTGIESRAVGSFAPAGTSQEHDDDHWVDNCAASPGKPCLRWSTRPRDAQPHLPPHNGGAPVLLYRLQRVADR